MYILGNKADTTVCMECMCLESSDLDDQDDWARLCMTKGRRRRALSLLRSELSLPALPKINSAACKASNSQAFNARHYANPWDDNRVSNHFTSIMSTPRAGPVCHLCRYLIRRPATTSTTSSSLSLGTQQRWLSQSSKGTRETLPKRPRHQKTVAQQSRQGDRAYATTAPVQQLVKEEQHVPARDLASLHARVEELATVVLEHDALPSEEDVSRALEEYQQIATTLLSQKPPTPSPAKPSTGSSATSALLSSVKQQHSQTAVTKAELLALISDRALDIMQYEPVFITAPLLKSYVSLQSLLGRPESFPAIFDLYRFKPVPRPVKSRPITYTNQNPDKPAAAVPPGIADAAINAAVTSRDLPLVLATIDATYCTTAYKRSKFLRSALFPLAGLALTPPAAYTLASRFSDWQTTMDSSTATQVAMAGILTYTTAVSTVGYVALTTANDQMVRVTWASGMPLWERWVREEERGAIDKVAQAWGFRSRDKWGEEEGEEWDGLREWIGLRGMMLDRVELMDGME